MSRVERLSRHIAVVLRGESWLGRLSATESEVGGSVCADRTATARRTSISLADRGLLRATTPSVLLSGIGRRMRKSVGGIGEVAESGDDAYRKSFAVDGLDIFLSHSWHTWWLLKYLTLLYYFNSVPAIVAMMFAGLLCILFQHYSLDGKWSQPESEFVHPWAQVFGCATFVATLLCWHHIAVYLRVAPTMFLDKVCIHQTDAVLKVKGIKSIGGILANSKLMLVTWDSTYFERLWCTYEMSAFKHGNPDGRIKVLPVVLGPFVLSYFLATFISDVVLQGVELTGKWPMKMNGQLYILSALLHLPTFTLCMRVMSRYINNLKKLKSQLATFSVRSAKCFCCDAKHVHPETGAQLPCDREVVNNSIENWMGLDTFDRMVRGDFKRFVKRTLGGRARIPYRFAVAASIYPGMSVMDHVVADRTITRPGFELLVAIEATFLRHPLIIALSVTFLLKFQDRMMVVFNKLLTGEASAKWALYTATGMVVSAIYYVFLITNHYVVTNRGKFGVAAWLLFETLSVGSLYFGGICWQTPMATRTSGREGMDFNGASNFSTGDDGSFGGRDSVEMGNMQGRSARETTVNPSW